MVVNPAHGQLDSENEFSLSSFAYYIRPSCPESVHSVSKHLGWICFPLSFPLAAMVSIATVVRYWANVELIRSLNCVPLAFNNESPMVQGQQPSEVARLMRAAYPGNHIAQPSFLIPATGAMDMCLKDGSFE